jgi:hypothetical protein
MDPQLQSPSNRSSIPAEVSGWLLALCLILTIVFPATTLYRSISHTIPTAIAAHTFNRIVLLSAYSLLFSALAVLSFMAAEASVGTGQNSRYEERNVQAFRFV